MTLLHVVYALFVAVLLTGAASLAEAGLRGAGRPARWVWVVALALSVSAPVWGPRVSNRSVEPLPAAVLAATDAAGTGEVAAPSVWASAQARLVTGLSRPLPVLSGLWWAMALLATAVVGVGLVRMERRSARLPTGRIDGEEVALSEDFGPALVGLRRPRTVLPRWVLSLARREVGLIVAHERAHRAAGDGRLLALGLLAVAACPWNPMVWLQFRRLRDAVEMDCDRRLLRDGVEFPAYARVLVLVRLRAADVGSGAAVALVESSSSLERRLKTMRGFMWTRRRVALTGAAALAMVVVACETPAPSEIDVQSPAETEIAAETGSDVAFGIKDKAGNVVRHRHPDDEGATSPDQPLIVVDGVILNRGRLSDVPKYDIERIEVVKGGAALEIFGERGRNGVVQIFTKGGQGTEVAVEESEVPLDELDLSFGTIRLREVPKERPGGGN